MTEQRGTSLSSVPHILLREADTESLSQVAEADGRKSPEQQDKALLPQGQKGACFGELSLARGVTGI